MSRQWAILVLVSDGLGLYGGLLASKAHNLLLSPPMHARRTANQCGGLISRDFLRGHRVPYNGVTVHRYIVTGTVPQTESLGGERGGVGEVWVGRVVRWGEGWVWGEGWDGERDGVGRVVRGESGGVGRVVGWGEWWGGERDGVWWGEWWGGESGGVGGVVGCGEWWGGERDGVGWGEGWGVVGRVVRWGEG